MSKSVSMRAVVCHVIVIVIEILLSFWMRNVKTFQTCWSQWVWRRLWAMLLLVLLKSYCYFEWEIFKRFRHVEVSEYEGGCVLCYWNLIAILKCLNVSDMSKSVSMRAAVCEAYREASHTPTIVAARIEKASADNLIITSRWCRPHFWLLQSLKMLVLTQI